MINSSASVHPSGLQTTRLNKTADPVQRFLANKNALEAFYAEMTQNVRNETKLYNLHQADFINWYKKPRYWDVCKYTSNDEQN